MPKPSTIDRLPELIREEIGKLRDAGRTIDEILAKLQELSVDVSRSALGRHVKQLDAIGAEIRRSRSIAEALVRQYGDTPESRTARLNLELMQGMMMKLLVTEEGELLQLDSKEAFFLATAMQKLSQAAKSDVDREAAVKKQFVKKLEEQVAAAEKAGESGLTKERIAELRREFLGVAG